MEKMTRSQFVDEAEVERMLSAHFSVLRANAAPELSRMRAPKISDTAPRGSFFAFLYEHRRFAVVCASFVLVAGSVGAWNFSSLWRAPLEPHNLPMARVAEDVQLDASEAQVETADQEDAPESVADDSVGNNDVFHELAP